MDTLWPTDKMEFQTMKPKIILCLALVLSGWLSAPARVVRSLSDTELMKASDLVVVGQPIDVEDLDETNSLGWFQSETFRPRFRGVETTFKVSDVLKGMPVNDHIALHHYRYETEWGSPPDGPDFISFTPNSTNLFLLYLKNEGENRYTPVSGQIDPGLSIKPAPDLFKLGYLFPLKAPIANADPAICHLVSVRVPTQLKIERTPDTLFVEIDTNSYESTNLTVGTNMLVGNEAELDVYPAGKPPALKSGDGSMGSGTGFSASGIWHTKPNGIPLPGKKYEVEMDLVVFETDIPPQHMWMPRGKNYKVLWRRTLKQIVE
jgi:hypothetical protein